MNSYPIFPSDNHRPAPVVTVLTCDSRLSLDPSPLSLIYEELGSAAAEETVCRALEDIARRLNDMQPARLDGDFDTLAPQAKRLSKIAGHIGLGEISEAAQHVATACGQRDGVAVEATIHRLERGFDVAVSQVWQFSELF